MRRKTLYFIIPFSIAVFMMGCRILPALPGRGGGIGSQDTTSNRFGFVGNGMTDNTQRIQTVIDSTSQAGGGMVVFANGTFLTGPIELKSNVTLEIKKGATLLGTTDKRAYYPAGTDTTGPIPGSLQPLITSDHANNIRISGGGTIDGSGQQWWKLYEQKKVARPRLIKLNHSTNIVIDSVRLQNSPQFNISLEWCRHVKVEYVTIKNPANSPNTDGVDPATCHDVTISHCTIDTGDDNVAVKSGRYDPSDPNAGTSNIVIDNNSFFHGHGVSIGSETNGGVDSMYVEHNSFSGTTNGFRIKTNRTKGGDIRNIVYNDNTMTNVENPIRLTTYYPDIPPQTDPAQPVTSTTPYYHDITIENLTSTNSPSAGLIVGLPEKPMKNIILKHVNIAASSGLLIRNAAVDTMDVAIHTTTDSGTGQISSSPEVVTGLVVAYENPTNPPSWWTSGEVQKVKPDASTSSSQGTYSWPDESAKNDSRYVEFAAGPETGYSFTVDSLAMWIGSKGISGMHAAIYYSTNSDFSSPRKLAVISSLAERPSIIDTSLTGNSQAGLGLQVNSGQKLYIRIYPWLPGGTSSTTKYMYIGNVRILGETQSPLAAAEAVWPLTGGTRTQPAPSSSGFVLQKGATLKGI